MDGGIDGWGERVSHLGSLERMTPHQEKDERMGGENGGGVWEGGRKEGRNTGQRETENRRRRHFFWVMQSL